MKTRTYQLTQYSPMQKLVKKATADWTKLYNHIFSVRISVKDVKKMHPKLKVFTARDVGALLFKQSLRDDIPKSEQAMVDNLNRNPYMPNINLYYNPKTHIMYKYNFKKDIRHYASTKTILIKLLHNTDYMNYCQKVADTINHHAKTN